MNRSRDYLLKAKYGITEAQLEEILSEIFPEISEGMLSAMAFKQALVKLLISKGLKSMTAVPGGLVDGLVDLYNKGLFTNVEDVLR